MLVKKKYALLILSFLLVLPMQSLYAQDSLFLGNEIERLIDAWHFHQKEQKIYQFGKDSSGLAQLFKLRNSNLVNAEYQNKIYAAEADRLHKDPALSANASYLENFTPSFNEDDDNLIYQRRYQAGINWQILKDGFASNRLEEKQLRNSILINEYIAPYELKENSYSANWNLIIYLFNKEKLNILQKRATLVGDLVEESEKLHLAKYLTRDNYIRYLSRQAEITALINIYQDYNHQFLSVQDSLEINVNHLPLLDINYLTVFEIIKPELKDSISKLYKENLSYQNSWINDVQLTTGLRYNYYDLVIPGNRSFFSMMINASVPIPFQRHAKNAINQLKVEQSFYQLEQQFDGRAKELLNECYEYRYKLKQLVNFNQKYQLYSELLRRLNATESIDKASFNPIEGLILLDDMLAIQMELIDLQQSLYLKLLKIYTKSGAKSINDITQNFSIPNYFDIHQVSKQSLYIWSSAFAKKSVAFISEYILFNKFNTLVISVNEDPQNSKHVNELVKILASRGKEFEAMIGNNRFIDGSITSKLEQLLQPYEANTFAFLHLDVEPHTFSDWNERKSFYLESYITMLKEARQFCDKKKMKLAVSIPLHYPEETVSQILTICDRVYFMAYENTKPDYVARKITPYANNGDKIYLAIRNKDFDSRIAMEKYIIEAYHNQGYTNFAYHDLSGLIDLDQKTIKK